MKNIRQFISIILCICLVLMSGCSTIILEDNYLSPSSEKSNESQENNFGNSEENVIDTSLYDYSANVIELSRENSEAIGWLYIPDTNIDAIVMQNPSRSNDEYLSLNFNRQYDAKGSICADNRNNFFTDNTRNDLSTITTLYAHSFSEDPSTGMFSGLKYYKDMDFAVNHPYIFFSTSKENMAFEVVAVFEAHTDLAYNHSEQSPEQLDRTFKNIFNSSLYNYDVECEVNDKYIILSTCAMTVQGHDNLDPYTTEYRFVVMGKLVQVNEATKSNASLTINPNPLAPDDIFFKINKAYIQLSGAKNPCAKYIENILNKFENPNKEHHPIILLNLIFHLSRAFLQIVKKHCCNEFSLFLQERCPSQSKL